MSVLVLCNIGNRDLLLEGESAAPHPARSAGQRLLEGYPSISAKLTFPIITPCLQYIATQHEDGIDRLVLYGTDQEDVTYQANDTLHFAALAARRLPEIMGQAPKEVSWQPVRDINPALYDEAFEAFDRLVAELATTAVEICYVIVTGGIPACNTALLFQGVRHFGPRLRVVYLPQGGEPQELRAGQQVTDAFREAAAVEHLERLDFANALPRLERLGCDRGLVELTAYAGQRLAFDFASAQDRLRDALKYGERPVRELINRALRHDLDRLLKEGDGIERLKALLRELYWNAAITYRHRRYADFLGRVYRFQEAVLRTLVEQILGLPTDLAPEVREANQRRWIEGIEANPTLIAYLEVREVDGEPLDWHKIGRPAYQALLSYATGEDQGVDAGGQPLLSPGERKRYQALLDRVNAFDRLVELRHRTIIGHDFAGVSQALVLDQYKGSKRDDGRRRTPIEGMEEIVRMVGVNLQDDPYQDIAELVIKHLRR